MNKYPIKVSKSTFRRHVNLLIGEEGKGIMFLSNILTHSCMIIHFAVEENIFVVIAFRKTTILKSFVNEGFVVNGEQMIKIPKKANMLDSKTCILFM